MTRVPDHILQAVKPFWFWAIAVAGSIALNVTLFGLMPGLIQKLPASPEELEDLKQVQMIRVKRSEIVQRKKKPVKPEPVKPIKQVKQARILPKAAAVKPRLDFKLNAKLPAAPMDLVMPALENFSMDGPPLKGVFDVGDLDIGLMALVKIPPVYPSRAKRRGIEGFVTIEFQVSPQGLVQQIIIVDASPEYIFNTSVKNCVSHWKFKPPTIEGVPVAARARTTIHFKLE